MHGWPVDVHAIFMREDLRYAAGKTDFNGSVRPAGRSAVRGLLLKIILMLLSMEIKGCSWSLSGEESRIF